VTDVNKIVNANSTIIPFVTFPGQEIQDLYVHEDVLPTPPAPVVATAAPVAPARGPAPSAAPVGGNKPKLDHRQEHTRQPRAQHNNSNNNNHHQVAPPQAPAREAAPAVSSARDNYAVGTGSHLLKLREKKTGDLNAAANSSSNDVEFNFEEGLKTFKKDDVEADVAADAAAHKYVKCDFFDNFSADIAGDGKKFRLTASAERNLNQDTFGAIALTNGYRRGGRGRGRGSGRGGGRGYGRGRGRQTDN
jgi:hypothetical protein